MKEEHANIAVARMGINMNFIVQSISDSRQPAVKGDFTPQQSIDPVATIAKIDTQPTDQEQVGLA
ncbi:MAG: hypothetical protein ACKO25_04325 [Cyanobium sp.]